MGVSTPVMVVREEEMLRHLASGMSLKDLAGQMGLSYQTVLRYAKREGFLIRLREYNSKLWERVDNEIQLTKGQDLAKRLEEAADEALDNMMALANGAKSEQVRLKANMDILDRSVGGTKVKHAAASQSAMPQINIAVLQQAARTMQEEQAFFAKRQEEQNLIDLTPVSEKSQ